MDKIEQSRIWDEKINQYINNLENAEKGTLGSEWLNNEAAYTKTIRYLKELYNRFARNNHPIPDELLNIDEVTVYNFKCIIQELAENNKGNHAFLTEEDYNKIAFEDIMNKGRTDTSSEYARRHAEYNKLIGNNQNNNNPKLR